LVSASVNSIPNRSAGKKSVASKAAGPGPHLAPMVGPRIRELIKEIDPNYGIESDAEEQILQLADDFLDKTIASSIRLAQHRGSKTLEVRDLQIILAKNFGIVVPGLGMPPARPTSRSSITSKVSLSGTKRNTSGGDISIAGTARKKTNTGPQEGDV